MVYEGVSGVRIHIRGQSSHTAVHMQPERKMTMIYRGLDVDRFTQEVNRWLSLTAPVVWGTIKTKRSWKFNSLPQCIEKFTDLVSPTHLPWAWAGSPGWDALTGWRSGDSRLVSRPCCSLRTSCKVKGVYNHMNKHSHYRNYRGILVMNSRNCPNEVS